MKIQLISLISAVLISLSLSQDAAELNAGKSPLIVYSGGFSAGSLFALNDELSDQSQQYAKLSVSNIFSVRERLDVFLDFNWFIPGVNFGGDFGFDYVFNRTGITPVIGFGIGSHYFEKEEQNFGKRFGPSATAHVGFMVDLTDNLIVRVRAPYHVIFNNDMDHGFGLNIGFIFASKFRNIKRLHH